LVFVGDTSKTDGSGLANLVHNSSGLVAYYCAGDLSNDVQITLATATLGTWTSGGFVAVDNTNMPGWYEIGIPDAALDGGNEVAIQLRGATNMAPVNLYIELDSVDYQDAAAFGLSRLDAAVSSRMATYAQPTGFLAATFPAVVSSYAGGAVASVTAPVTVGTNNDKTGYSLTPTTGFGNQTANITGNLSGSVGSVTGAVGSVTNRVTANTDQWGGVAVTGMPLPTTSYTAPDNATISSISSNLVIVNNNVLTRLAALAYTTPPSAATNATAVRTELTTELARIDAAISTRLAATSYTAPDNASVAAIKSVTDKLNTTLVADGLLWQYTVNALENAPGGGGGGSATLENQELILANLDNVTGAVSAAVARLQLETQITGFPATLCRGSDYDTTLESEIRLQLLDLNNAPITEIGGTPVDEITWLFGLGTDRQPRLVEGACSWNDTTDELVIELAATDTNTTPLGSVTWQIGAQIGELVRWLGGGTTRIVERQFAA
jgi:hypothetical protein